MNVVSTLLNFGNVLVMVEEKGALSGWSIGWEERGSDQVFP